MGLVVDLQASLIGLGRMGYWIGLGCWGGLAEFGICQGMAGAQHDHWVWGEGGIGYASVLSISAANVGVELSYHRRDGDGEVNKHLPSTNGLTEFRKTAPRSQQSIPLHTISPNSRPAVQAIPQHGS